MFFERCTFKFICCTILPKLYNLRCTIYIAQKLSFCELTHTDKSREPPSPCKNFPLIDDGKCDLINFNEKCNFDGKDCCPNPSAIGNGNCSQKNNILWCNFDGGDCCSHENVSDGICNMENLNRMCDYDGGDCCDHQKVGDGTCDIGNLNDKCDFDGEWSDCFCDYKDLKRDGHCNLANNKSSCLFDDFDCICSNSTFINGHYIGCDGV